MICESSKKKRKKEKQNLSPVLTAIENSHLTGEGVAAPFTTLPVSSGISPDYESSWRGLVLHAKVLSILRTLHWQGPAAGRQCLSLHPPLPWVHCLTRQPWWTPGMSLWRTRGWRHQRHPSPTSLAWLCHFRKKKRNTGQPPVPLEVILSQPLPPSEAAHLHEGVIRDLTSVISF